MDWSLILSNTFRQMVGTDAMYFAIAALGLNVQFGYTGLLNFGQAGFMAAGGYGLGMTAWYFGISLWWGIPIAIVYALILGLLMGIPTLRLRSDYLAIVTIAAAEIIRLVVRSVRFKKQFGGTDGIGEFAGPFREAGSNLGIEQGNKYGFWVFDYTGRQFWTLVVGWILVAIFGFVVYLLMRSPWGRVLKAIREDEDAVRSLGKNVYSYKMQSLLFGGVLGAFAGMMLALDRGNVQPDNYSRDLTFYVLTALVLGGLAKVSGSIVGPMLYWGAYVFIEGVLRGMTSDGPLQVGGVTIIQSTQVGQVQLMMVGAGLIALMTFRPQGLFGNREEMAFDDR
jgi:neutral amino acid transport system permease protein